jgi:ElaB/YqjD/DUF883 family membrane-anchored ribosome-binding protein
MWGGAGLQDRECILHETAFHVICENAMELGTENVIPSNNVAGEDVDFTLAARARTPESDTGDASDALGRARATARPAGDWLSEQVDRVNATQEKALADVRRYVRDQPFKAIGIAVAVGWLYDRLRG